ncbi:hypothetical protein WMY93_022936 [Mugilogobius chulae]|uniref:Mannose-6-phosphate isomerase n=1 Tax=Mugilogobius chulae TaxID=88201 RepID=A0AAW0N7U1_9GOBI
MELASEDQQQPSARPKRDSCLPKHLAQYDVTLLPSQQPAVQDSPLPEGQRDESRPYRAGSASGYPSTTRSQRSSRHSSQRLKLLETMPDAKAAALEEQIKGLELADLQQEIEEERQADLETTKLDEQAREGQRLQEEAHRAKERMAREMGRRRRLKKLEKGVKIAGAVKSFLSESEDDTRPTVLAPPDSDKRVSQSLTNRVPTLQPSVHAQHPQQQSPVQVPSTVTVAQPLAPNVNPVMRVQTGAPMPATLPVTRASVAAPRPASVAPISQYMPGLPTFASTPAPAATVPQVTQPPATTAFQSQYPGLPVIGSDSTIPPAVTVANLPSVVQYAAPVIPDVAPAPSMPPWSYPGLETLIASSYGIPKPALPIFESGRESDFALLKMALDNLMNSHPHLSEHYKYQVLLSQLKLPSALQLAKSYMYDSRPYTAALGALQDKYGQPRQLVQSELGAILNSPAINSCSPKRYEHLKGLPLSPIHRAQPLLLIGSDMPHLLTPTQPVRAGPSGGPIAICTRLGWSLQGPSEIMLSLNQSCLHIATESSYTELFKNVERLWHIDTLPYVSEKSVTRSKQDQQALTLLQTTSERVSVDNVPRYATPLLRRQPVTALCAPPDAVMPSLRSIERRLTKDPARAASYCKEMDKLVQAGYVAEVPAEEASKSTESWYVPHHMVHHNGKDRVVFNCSFSYNGQSLNDYLLPGPTLGPTMIGVLLRFRRHAVAISGDIKSMFHQIRLLPADKPLLRFLWRNMEKTSEPRIFEWQVLPFGTTCSPCCAVYALQQHVRDHEPPDSLLMKVVEHSFYVDNCLHSVSKVEDAKALIDDLRALLSKGGFEIRQWASNVPAVVAHLPSEAQSTSSELWAQHYSWGKLGLDSEVAQLLLHSATERNIDADTPYAELCWQLAHPKADSRILSDQVQDQDQVQTLGSWLQKNPQSLGSKVRQRFNGKLPFLFNLSVRTALSIQAHPDQELAVKLHAQFPEHYPDENHKPEMAIALTPFTGMCGFRPVTEILDHMSEVPELVSLVGSDSVEDLKSKISDEEQTKSALKTCFSRMMKSHKDLVKTELHRLVQRASAGQAVPLSSLLLKLHSQFPGDIGCFCIFFLNLIHLQPGDAMFLRANEIHAYVEGDCVEVMACSDNTVRAGLTPKFLDVETLCEMLDYTSSPAESKLFPCRRDDQDSHVTLYDPPIDDFSVMRIPGPGGGGLLHCLRPRQRQHPIGGLWLRPQPGAR